MNDSFVLGASYFLLIRFGAMRLMRAPLFSRPLRIIPEMIVGGLFMSLFDYYRRVGLENVLKTEEIMQVADIMRRNEANYGSHTE